MNQGTRMGSIAEALAKEAGAGRAFRDVEAPPEVYATLLDEGIYHGSIRTMYRLLAREGEVRERRGQRRRAHDHKPELLATGPHQVWSWDITTLKGPVTWSDDSL